MTVIVYSASDLIAIINIVVTVGIGIWIATGINHRVKSRQNVKDFFIKEINEINSKYKKFFSDSCNNKKSAQNIIEWFKIMTININLFQSELKQEFKINSELQNINNKLKYRITSDECFNENFKAETLEISPTLKSDLYDSYNEITSCIINLIVKINKK